ncbi:sarcosine oxidase subunit alpha family protein [Leisingera aquaemixtae]|uniref:sarcosine oxidase subunit alpha family protein n=1 Tax=Leisingera aquaemixtae TaxID=1396826 RepID=UPI001C94AFF3|nr:sarcosine oxidase subunit alpha family protein [Leisingera aquaemixtae]MBY6068830.1 sarcosine oxidase subunit alpha family protein [Leisingera aquaemixtae]
MTRQTHRLNGAGSRLDRSKPISFTFDGKRYSGYEGDTLASALLANGVRLVARSFKYHRPRGIFTCDPHEPSALVQLRSGARQEPNIPATMVELYDGLEATSQNRWPSLRYDLLSVNQLFSPFFAAGFYYKTFKWPAKFWTNLYEPVIRRAAGMGRLSGGIDPDTYEKIHHHCDILVIGGGGAGISAARAAAQSGARVTLVEEHARLGGFDSTGLEQDIAELEALENVRILPRTMVFGWYDNNTFGAVEQVSDHLPVPAAHQPRQRMWKIVAPQVILATGAHERSLVFGNNDRPGVMLASAAERYLRDYGVRTGSRAVIFTTNDSTTGLVKALGAAGVTVAAVADARNGDEIETVHGRTTVTGVTLRQKDGSRRTVDCDTVCVSGGWNPAVQLLAQRGQKPHWSENLQAFLPQEMAGADFLCTGSLVGLEAHEDCQTHGRIAGEAAGKRFAAPDSASLADYHNYLEASEQRAAKFAYFESSTGKSKKFIDLQHDVTAGDVSLATREGYRSVEHVKRYTTLGMATDQGKTSNIHGIAAMSKALDKPMSQVGTTGFRPPYRPVSLGALAGRSRGKHWRPILRTPLHGWVEDKGGVFIESGLWHRSQYFPKPGETMSQAISREVQAVRSAVGFCDVSTLGKIDLQGPDAAAFLDRVYSNGFAKLPVGKSRYGLMLREDGIVMDDGTVSRLAEDHYFITTTSAESDSVISHLEYCHQVLWPELDVVFADAGEDWAGIALAGPRARDVLARIAPEMDVSNAALPFLAARECTVLDGVPARLFRISFSGELAYEIYVPSPYGRPLAEALEREGAEFGITPYGVEALDVLRIEKGHVSSELNKFTTAADLGLGMLMSAKKDFIGRALSSRPGLTDPDREVVVGLKPLDPSHSFRQGAHITASGAPLAPENDDGYITSAAWSPTMESCIAIALVRRGRERLGEVVEIIDPLHGEDPVPATIVSHHFYDPENTRVRS